MSALYTNVNGALSSLCGCQTRFGGTALVLLEKQPNFKTLAWDPLWSLSFIKFDFERKHFTVLYNNDNVSVLEDSPSVLGKIFFLCDPIWKKAH